MTQRHKIQLFEDKKVRTAWDDEREEWYFSIVDVCGVLTESLNKIGMTSRTTNMEMKAYLDLGYDECIEAIKNEIEYEEFRDDIVMPGDRSVPANGSRFLVNGSRKYRL